jgi:glycine cleavage system H protein
VKAVSELFAPVGGEVVAVNTELPAKPEQINADPHGAWMIKLKVTAPNDVRSLLDSTQYGDLVK